uniref:Uncharacterized protein n=1 Tax=Myoviridae sp. ctq8k5 TaxID=2826701 RepID=A0A8S5QXW2_9CAUD|nr:MAG TPA: hypothetical protein [Myoviridae sp. ctq8k5]
MRKVHLAFQHSLHRFCGKLRRESSFFLIHRKIYRANACNTGHTQNLVTQRFFDKRLVWRLDQNRFKIRHTHFRIKDPLAFNPPQLDLNTLSNRVDDCKISALVYQQVSAFGKRKVFQSHYTGPPVGPCTPACVCVFITIPPSVNVPEIVTFPVTEILPFTLVFPLTFKFGDVTLTLEDDAVTVVLPFSIFMESDVTVILVSSFLISILSFVTVIVELGANMMAASSLPAFFTCSPGDW